MSKSIYSFLAVSHADVEVFLKEALPYGFPIETQLTKQHAGTSNVGVEITCTQSLLAIKEAIRAVDGGGAIMLQTLYSASLKNNPLVPHNQEKEKT